MSRPLLLRPPSPPLSNAAASRAAPTSNIRHPESKHAGLGQVGTAVAAKNRADCQSLSAVDVGVCSGRRWWEGVAAGLALTVATPQPAAVQASALVTDNTDSIPLREFRETRSATPDRPPQQRAPALKQQRSVSVREQVAEILKLTNDARFATDGGDYAQALAIYSSVVDEYPDFAITDYARLDRALLLFQSGDRSRAILELEDLEFTEKGSAELSAAVAAALYSERPQLLGRAESEWRIVDAFDRRYYDLDWVRSQKHWPPAMVDALSRFLSLSGR